MSLQAAVFTYITVPVRLVTHTVLWCVCVCARSRGGGNSSDSSVKMERVQQQKERMQAELQTLWTEQWDQLKKRKEQFATEVRFHQTDARSVRKHGRKTPEASSFH